MNLDFDTRAALLETEVQDTWEPRIQKQWTENLRHIREGVIHEFGADRHEQKLVDFKAMGSAPMSILAFHNTFYRQIRASFTIGTYYPALLGAAALGERILNHLIILLRHDFECTQEYPQTVKKQSFDDWDWMIKTLVAWSVLVPEAAEALSRLKVARHSAVHFRPDLDEDARPAALNAILLLSTIIEAQFATFGLQPWFIPNTPGASYIRRGATDEPFVHRVLLPNAVLVGPRDQLHPTLEGWRVESQDYPDVEVTDEEFVAMLRGEA